MHPIKYLSIFILCLYYATQTFAQKETGSINGKITDENRAPVPGALIKILNSSLSTTSDLNGNFYLKNIPFGKQTVQVSSVGMKSKFEEFNINKPNQSLNFTLQEDIQQMKTVSVLGRTETQEANRQAYNVTAIDAKKLHNTSLDIGQALDRVTGIRVKETGGLGSNISVSLNGFSGNQIKFFVDGLPMDNFGSSFQLNNIPVNFADRIEVYKGVVPIWLGGDALGGAVNIITKSTPRTYLDASYSIGSFNTHKTNINTGYTAKSGFAVQLNAFQNYSDNNYWVNVDVADLETGVYTPMRVRRFHDNYHNETAVFNIGVMGKKYADQFLVGVTLGQNKADIQTGNRMYDVYGGRLKRGNIVQPTLKYIKKDLIIKGLDLNVSGRYNLGEERSIDTSNYRFNWQGVGVYTGRGYEVNRRDFSYRNNNGVFSGNVTYSIDDKHSISLNHMANTFNRKGLNALASGNEADKQPQRTIKNVTGLGYKYDANEKWSNTLFIKNYHQYSHSSELLNNQYTERKGSVKQLGYGAASTYFVFPNLQLKASYEKAYRLPDNNELFGDVELLRPNPNLKPESSDNINISGNYSFSINNVNHFNIELNYSHRDAKDFIRWYLEPVSFTGIQSQIAINTRDVINRGFEAELRYSYRNIFNIGANLTYQNLRNNTKVEPGKTEPSPYYRERIPNMPYLFGNANTSFIINNIGLQKNTLTLGYNLLFVEQFYLRWPSYGSIKNYVPAQFSHNANLVYQIAKGKYNLALECYNLTDNELYDNFMLQRPSRSFTFKVRYFFGKDLTF